MVDSRDMVDNRGTAGTPSNRGTERLLLNSTEVVDMGDLLRDILSSNNPSTFNLLLVNQAEELRAV